MAERADPRAAPASNTLRFLTFRAAGRLYALPAEAVREIVLLSPMAKVPLSPKPLLGLANLRGGVLPVASLRLLLGEPIDGRSAHGERIIVLEGPSAFGLLVDEVAAFTQVLAGNIAAEEAQIASEAGENIIGAFKVEGSDGVARILDIHALLARALGVDTRRSPSAALPVQRQGRTSPGAGRRLETFITFEVAGQEFGLPLESVREVLPTADVTTPLPRAESAVLGMTALRDLLLPLLSMRALLGFAPDAGRRMTLVASISGVSVGLAVDSVRDIVRADPSELEAVPAAIASRTQGEASVQSVLKIDGGARLIAILAPNKLFREDVMMRIKHSADAAVSAPLAATASGAERIFVVFTLGGQEFGLAISAVEEVARMPEGITALPRSPDFLLGVVNLRGTVLPIIDQRRRFGLQPGDDA
ncbi:MAG: hypothetical protein EON93_05820, partial [Burkholderiales bacterium]